MLWIREEETVAAASQLAVVTGGATEDLLGDPFRRLAAPAAGEPGQTLEQAPSRSLAGRAWAAETADQLNPELPD